MSKLYTEEQVKYAIQVAFDAEPPCKVKDILRDLTPIELPTDEEIAKGAEWLDNPLERIGFKEGAKWMRDKIKGGGDE